MDKKLVIFPTRVEKPIISFREKSGSILMIPLNCFSTTCVFQQALFWAKKKDSIKDFTWWWTSCRASESAARSKRSLVLKTRLSRLANTLKNEKLLAVRFPENKWSNTQWRKSRRKLCLSDSWRTNAFGSMQEGFNIFVKRVEAKRKNYIFPFLWPDLV